MLYAHLFLGRYATGLSAYNALQARLLRRYLHQGGSVEEWCTRIAPAFRSRYGWMVDGPVAERQVGV